MQSSTSPPSPRKKLKSPLQDIALNPKTSITCSNVPESLFDPPTVKKHFSKFGRVLKIRLFSKRRMCIIEYEQPSSAERALLNAGAFDGFMFDVTRSKSRVRRRSSVKEDDPDWVPDSDVEEELSAMGSTPTYRVTRQNDPNIQPPPAAVPQLSRMKVLQRTVKNSPLKKKLPVREKPIVVQTASNILEPPMAVTTTQTTLSMSEAASELLSLRSKISLTPDEKWRVLDARDRVLRAWGGAGSRIKVGGATIGTCQDMCPEKELLQRQAEHQVMTLETVLDSDGEMEPWRAVKQYSRSSADQEIPMCYELRPTQALMRTTAYLLHEIADTKRQVSLADWFHFMWDRLRGIRKDITQQALCCQDSICLVEMCARFHAHCAARLADLEHTQFDQKLNTDNLTKCLQTLKHMYADVGALQKPREAEFRGYIALLNLGDANFWWEIQQLPEVIQKSEPIEFAIKVFNAIDNNNYVRFFRLVKNEATYLQACILLRYFNDVRARGLARIVKAYAPRGGSRYPADDMMRILAFESNESLKSFINHYGLRFGRTDDSELSVILDRNQFIEDSDPYPIARAINLIESKRNCTVGEIIAGGTLPNNLLYKQHSLYSSFTPDGKLKESALVAEEQGYNTANDSNKDVKALKAEIQRLSQGSKLYPAETTEPKTNIFVKTDPKLSSPKSARTFTIQANAQNDTNLFFFKPAIPVASTDIINNSSDKTFNSNKNIFSFSKPQETVGTENIFGLSESKFDTTRNIFSKPSVDNDNSHPIFESTNYKDNIFKEKSNETTIFKQATESNSANLFAGASGNIFSANESNQQQQHSLFGSKNIFAAKTEKVEENKTVFGGKNLFVTKEEKSTENQTSLGAKNIFAIAKNNLFEKPNSTTTFEKSSNIFTKPVEINNSSNIFGAFGKTSENTNTFAKSDINKASTIFSNGKTTNAVSPASLFKSIINGSDTKSYSIFQSKNKAQTVADNILNSVTTTHAPSVYEFNQNDNEYQNDLDIQTLQNQKMLEEERKLQQKQREEEMRKQELRRQEEEKLKEEARKKKEELQLIEQKRRSEELRKQKELRMKLESEKKKIEQEKKAAELKRKADEERKYREKVDKESADLVVEIIDEISNATVKDIMKEENEKFNYLMQFAESVTDEIISNLCTTICKNELKAEQFLTKKIMRKWYSIWRSEYIRNIKRRNILNDTPVWLTQNTPDEEAALLHRIVENAALNNMHAIHSGYRFTGELKTFPLPEPYDIMAIIRSPLLKRMKEIKYPYDKCFFWKITLVLPGSRKWIHRKINVEKWLLDVFSDKKKHDVSDSLIHVGKHSWNRLMDFAISVSITSEKQDSDVNEAINGANGLLFYATQLDNDLLEVINNTLKYKYPYQVVPIAVIVPVMANDFVQTKLEVLLNDLVKSNIIAAYRVFVISSNSVFESLNVTTKTAMKWLAKKYPRIPPLEVDYLKSICQRYLGNEIWCRLKLNRNGRMHFIAKDLCKLVRCYNTAVEKLTEVITNEDLFNYSSFPLEFQPFLDSTSPYPKPFEFIPSSVKSSENLLAIKRIMKKLKLPDPSSEFNPVNAITMQQQITSYCNQIGWFDNPKEVVDKVVAVLPNELLNVSLPCADFRQYYAQYNLLDFMNIIVYEKIKALENFENRFAIYEKPVLEDYREALWLHDINIIKDLKHKALEYEDEIDFFIEAKRRKVAMDSLELLMLEDKDVTMVEEDIKEKDLSICKYNNCTEAMKQLENMLEKEKMKTLQFENFLKAALGES